MSEHPVWSDSTSTVREVAQELEATRAALAKLQNEFALMLAPLTNIATIWRHLEMDTPEDQALHTRALALTDEALSHLHAALGVSGVSS